MLNKCDWWWLINLHFYTKILQNINYVDSYKILITRQYESSVWESNSAAWFLDAIASLEIGYESKWVCVIKPNNGYIAKHGAIIEYTLNVYWMYIEYTLKYCKTWCNT